MIVTDSDLYRRSSQYRKWTFTREQLEKMETKVNRRVAPTELALSPAEEKRLVSFCATEQLKQLCEAHKLSSQVRATALAYFRRFYLKHSVMEFLPRLVLPTCVFLAAKAENQFVPLTKFCEVVAKLDPQDILDFEFSLFSALEFTLSVHSPTWPLHGLFLDMQTVLAENNEVELLCEIHDKAKALLLSTLASDASFLYTPTQIALAAMMAVHPLKTTEYMALCMGSQDLPLERLLKIVEECKDMLVAFGKDLVSLDEFKALSKRLNQYYKSKDKDNAKRQRTE